MRRCLKLLGVCLAFLAPGMAHADLTGDAKLACEAILCLSSGTRPTECMPSLARYFGFNGKDAFKDRRNFLNLCPTASAPNMPSLVNAIVDSAGQCDVAQLNARTKTVQVQTGYCGNDSQACGVRDVIVIDDSYPQNCAAYYSHIYVRGASRAPVYVGTPLEGGRWE